MYIPHIAFKDPSNMILSFPAAKMVTDEQTDGANQYAPSTSTTWGEHSNEI